MASDGQVRGMAEAMKQAEVGLQLLKATEDGPIEVDLPAAEAYKSEVEARIVALEEEASKLTGKDNKKERTAKGKEVAELKAQPQYIDACKVAKGLEPKNGFFVLCKAPAAEAAPSAQAVPEAPAEVAKEKTKEDKKPKKTESAGLSPAETKELEKIKQDIIDRKAQLKAEGLSGGQQNKDPQVVEWVARMNELKEKQDPGSTQKDAKKDDKKKSKNVPLSQEEQKQLDELQGEIEAYKHRCKTEFGYTNKDMKADPDLKEMEAQLAALEKRSR